MAKKQSESLVRGKQAKKKDVHISDSKINFTDIPQSSDEELKRATRVGRPSTGNAKHLIAIRIDPKLLARLRKQAAKQDMPYQTLIHEILEKAADEAA